MPWSQGGTKSTDCAPKGFSPKAYYLFDSEIELVWERVSDGHHSHSAGWYVCVCVVLEFMRTPSVIYLVPLQHHCGIWPETPSLFQWGESKHDGLDFYCPRQWFMCVCVCHWRIQCKLQQSTAKRGKTQKNLNYPRPFTNLLIKWQSKLLMCDARLWSAGICLLRHNVQVDPLQYVLLWQ